MTVPNNEILRQGSEIAPNHLIMIPGWEVRRNETRRALADWRRQPRPEFLNVLRFAIQEEMAFIEPRANQPLAPAVEAIARNHYRYLQALLETSGGGPPLFRVPEDNFGFDQHIPGWMGVRLATMRALHAYEARPNNMGALLLALDRVQAEKKMLTSVDAATQQFGIVQTIMSHLLEAQIILNERKDILRRSANAPTPPPVPTPNAPSPPQQVPPVIPPIVPPTDLPSGSPPNQNTQPPPAGARSANARPTVPPPTGPNTLPVAPGMPIFPAAPETGNALTQISGWPAARQRTVNALRNYSISPTKDQAIQEARAAVGDELSVLGRAPANVQELPVVQQYVKYLNALKNRMSAVRTSTELAATPPADPSLLDQARNAATGAAAGAASLLLPPALNPFLSRQRQQTPTPTGVPSLNASPSMTRSVWESVKRFVTGADTPGKKFGVVVAAVATGFLAIGAVRAILGIPGYIWRHAVGSRNSRGERPGVIKRFLVTVGSVLGIWWIISKLGGRGIGLGGGPGPGGGGPGGPSSRPSGGPRNNNTNNANNANNQTRTPPIQNQPQRPPVSAAAALDAVNKANIATAQTRSVSPSSNSEVLPPRRFVRVHLLGVNTRPPIASGGRFYRIDDATEPCTLDEVMTHLREVRRQGFAPAVLRTYVDNSVAPSHSAVIQLKRRLDEESIPARGETLEGVEVPERTVRIRLLGATNVQEERYYLFDGTTPLTIDELRTGLRDLQQGGVHVRVSLELRGDSAADVHPAHLNLLNLFEELGIPHS